MTRSIKKGPFVDCHLQKKVDEPEREGYAQRHQDVVPSFDDHP